MELSLLHQIIMNQALKESTDCEIGVYKFRIMLTRRFRIPKQLVNRLILELKQLKCIEFNNHKSIKICFECDEDLI